MGTICQVSPEEMIKQKEFKNCKHKTNMYLKIKVFHFIYKISISRTCYPLNWVKGSSTLSATQSHNHAAVWKMKIILFYLMLHLMLKLVVNTFSSTYFYRVVRPNSHETQYCDKKIKRYCDKKIFLNHGFQ